MSRRKDPVGRYLLKKKKQREKDAIRIDTADYDYMDDMPLEGWIWEIMRRSEKYQQEFNQLQERLREIIKNSKEKLSEFPSVLLEASKAMGMLFIISVKGVNYNPDHVLEFTIKHRRKSASLVIPEPGSKYIDVKDVLCIKATQNIEVSLFDAHLGGTIKAGDFTIASPYKNPYESLVHFLAMPNPEDTIYVGVSKQAKIVDIEKRLLPLIKKYLKPKPVRARGDKWKYYLIVYDLKKMHGQKITYIDIAMKLKAAYPSIKTNKVIEGKRITKYYPTKEYFTAENCKNFYKEAVVLINGDYRNYLYL